MSPHPPSPSAKAALVLAAAVMLAGAYSLYQRAADNALRSHREVEAVRAEVAGLKRENARMQRQLGDMDQRLGQEGRGAPSAGEPLAPARPAREVPPRVAARVSKLREYLAEHPEDSGPEMRLIKDDDWVDPVSDIRLDTEASMRKALAQVRMQAQARVGEIVATAVRDYMDANNGQPPTSAAQLAPYLSDPADADLLQGFENAGPGSPPGAVFQKTYGADDWFGSRCSIEDDHYYVYGNGPGLAVERAIAAFQQATGNPPTDASQIVPYLQEPVSPSVASAVFAGLRPSPNSPPVISRGGAVSSIGGNGSPR